MLRTPIIPSFRPSIRLPYPGASPSRSSSRASLLNLCSELGRSKSILLSNLLRQRGAMATTTAAMAATAQLASLSLSSSTSPSTSSASASSFHGQTASLSVRRLAVVPSIRTRGLQVRAGGTGFIPAEHRWMYEGIEKMGPVSIPLLIIPGTFVFTVFLSFVVGFLWC